jgi:hypothetical protein
MVFFSGSRPFLRKRPQIGFFIGTVYCALVTGIVGQHYSSTSTWFYHRSDCNLDDKALVRIADESSRLDGNENH